MRSSLISMLIALVVIGGIVIGGFFIYKKFSVSADTAGDSSCAKADINKDGKVNSLDLNILIKAVAQGSTDTVKFDINSDKQITNADIEAQKSCWSRSSSGSAL